MGGIPSSKLGDADKQKDGVLPVGIIGAGIGGLYTALMLDFLGISYEVLEAKSHSGGRLFTHHFKNGKFYDYYDVGAMRFPLPKKDGQGKYEDGVMKRLAKLFEYPKLNTGGELQLESKLRPYFFKASSTGTGKGFLYFNGVRALNDPSAQCTFHAEEMGVPDVYIKVGVERIVDDVVQPFAKGLLDDLKTGSTSGWDCMMQFDKHSMRSYLTMCYIPSKELDLPEEHLSTSVINWLETFDKSSGWYDRALTETVLEALAFAKVGDETPVDWKCLDGGSQVLTTTMETYLQGVNGKKAIQFEKLVTAIAPADASDTKSPLNVTVDGEQQPRSYEHVISTLPIPCLRTIDISQCNLSVLQTNSLRELEYGPSIKIGIQFKSPWWTTAKDENDNPLDIIGGQSFTDLPIRTVVYPSYGTNTATPSTVLIASYCWTNDAERLGALIRTGEKRFDCLLKDMVLRDLAAVHNVSKEFLEGEFVDWHLWDWNHDPYTMGAFAFFGPGQYETLYNCMNLPATNGRLHFAGEALSVRHAWVVGALDSAWKAVHEYLILTHPSKLEAFFKEFGKSWDWFTPPAPQEDHDGKQEEGGEEKLPGAPAIPGTGLENNLLFQHMVSFRPELFNF
ncbi:hypothetical protein BDQ12DRAFT_609672 [Crucibulum laeve]|uniref:Amine oxidase domain-containing protein n=1 Tax=Crucibulum laeve TaxID=68775 RepID=A0A5C3LVX5_9AGAR|nr:hypothetical protein BDQ12DRAFT_609672 [Crucibulum laeve]